ncbi:Tyrosinase [Fusarium keratoplasticum]|nr:Tyrosinase [Fusarium keratoplasticum]
MPPFNPPQPGPNEPYVVKGIDVKPGQKPGIRQELRELKKNEDAWNLYLLGLWQFELVPQDRLLSYFQIAGIHGLPYKGWPENDPELLKLERQRTREDGFGGFCTHSSILFLTWHRPYLALFESVLRDAMMHVAKQFTAEEGQEKYVAAAEAFRMPFWDWARPDLPVFPAEASSSKVVQVKMPDSLRKEYNFPAGKLVEIPNPLYSYKFQPGTQENIKVDRLSTTTRYHQRGKSEEEESAVSKRDLLIESITPYTKGVDDGLRMEVNLRERVVYLLQSYELFEQVSLNKVPPGVVQPGKGQDETVRKGRGFGSFEDVHNTVHVLSGGTGDRSGHMGRTSYSAFDPIFWLHHTNIDRLLAIWQGLRENPDKEDAWVTNQIAGDGNWAVPTGGKEGNQTPLLPFYRTADKAVPGPDKFWKSSQVRDTATFGYAYPETQHWDFADLALYRESIKDQLRSLYPSGSLANMVVATRGGNEKPDVTLRERATRLRQVQKVDAPNTALTALSLAHAAKPAVAKELQSILTDLEVPKVTIPKERSVADLVKGQTYLEWLVNIKAVKHALAGQYGVHVFLGDVPEEEPTTLYVVSPYHVGTFSPFGQDEETSCGKCKEDQAAGLEISGQIPLTIALAERYFAGQLPSLEEEDVKDYLTKNLHWEVVDQNGQRLRRRRDDLAGLLVGVVSNEVTLPDTENGFPSYSEYIKVYPEITTNREGNGRGEGTGVTEGQEKFCC